MIEISSLTDRWGFFLENREKAHVPYEGTYRSEGIFTVVKISTYLLDVTSRVKTGHISVSTQYNAEATVITYAFT